MAPNLARLPLVCTGAEIETSWRILQGELRKDLQDPLLRVESAPVYGSAALLAELKSSLPDWATRRRGGRAAVVRLLPSSRIHPAFWLSYYEEWHHQPKNMYRFNSVGLTIFMERSDNEKTQLFRAEWAGILDIDKNDDAPRFQADGAGHPHWQFDALHSVAEQYAREQQHRSLGDVLAETPEVFDPEAEVSRTLPNQPVFSIATEVRWARAHFASFASWCQKEWDGSPRLSDPHARGPESTLQIRRWSLSTIRYLRRELSQ